MATYDTIIKELKEVPPHRLKDLLELVRSLTRTSRRAATSRKKVLSFAGVFAPMSEKTFADFQKRTKDVRDSLLDRDLTR